jgi:hypothetical protein
VDNSSTPNKPPPPDSDRFQFGVGSLLVLTAAWAVVLALAGRIGGPTPFRLGVAVYFIGLATYAVLRIPYLCRQIRRGRIRQRQIEQECRQIVRQTRDEASPNQ